MNYTDAIVYLKEHGIKKEDGTFYEFGDVSRVSCDLSPVAPLVVCNMCFSQDIPEAPERQMTDQINQVL